MNKMYMAPAIDIIKQAAVSEDVQLRILAVHVASSLIPFLEDGAAERLHAGEWASSQGICRMPGS